jgi:hypothetical protein
MIYSFSNTTPYSTFYLFFFFSDNIMADGIVLVDCLTEPTPHTFTPTGVTLVKVLATSGVTGNEDGN